MTPKEKAKELYNKFYQLSDSIEWTTDEETKQKAGKFNDELGSDVEKFWVEYPKQCALIALDEIMKIFSEFNPWGGLDYWYKVKQEIEKL